MSTTNSKGGLLTKKQLAALSETELQRRVLEPLFLKMGFRGVLLNHGSTERGKDFVAWRMEEFDERRNYAFVVKKGRIDGRAGAGKGTASTVAHQVRLAFNTPFRDPDSGAPCKVHTCWVITNGAIIPTAIESIMGALADSGHDNHIGFFDLSRLWKLYTQYFPVDGVWGHLMEAAQALPESEHYVVQPSISLSILPKHPTTGNGAPLIKHAQFKFPDTDEGRAVLTGLERFRAQGGKYEIPATFVEQVEFPEIMRELFNLDVIPTPNIVLEGEPSTVRLLISMEVERQDGSTFAFPTNIELKPVQIGAVKAILDNHHQALPLIVTVTLDVEKKETYYNLTFAPPANVKQLVDCLRLRVACEYGKAIQLVSLETGMSLFGSSLAVTTKKDTSLQDFLEELEDLLAVQQHVNLPIVIPSWRFGAKNNRAIRLLRAVVNETAWEGIWGHFAAELYPEGVQIILSNMGKEGKKHLRVEQDESVELFGQTIPLGRVRQTMRDVLLVDEAKVRRQLAASKGDDKAIRVEFKPGEDDVLEIDYLEWHPGAERIPGPALLGTAVVEGQGPKDELKPSA